MNYTHLLQQTELRASRDSDTSLPAFKIGIESFHGTVCRTSELDSRLRGNFKSCDAAAEARIRAGGYPVMTGEALTRIGKSRTSRGRGD